ncbi:hypothetical protein MED01_002491 [Micromonospora sp. MED01]|uniref:hypothetical protein n=1 Tax=Micromonospora alfalfae TaxID=2911212 RepID=UPI001EE7837A|nr:hypothetical protein [Micromonospora alfalfae]MCG5464325.1 hypothetical protein [Micromonospora alfalfae]
MSETAQPDRLAADLAATTANLAEYIEQRAQQLARPRIARAERAAAERVAEVEQGREIDQQRWTEVERELRRCIASLERQRDRAVRP